MWVGESRRGPRDRMRCAKNRAREALVGRRYSEREGVIIVSKSVGSVPLYRRIYYEKMVRDGMHPDGVI